jgi:hypothetical protein
MTAAEVVAAGEKAGLVMTKILVHKVRSRMRQASGAALPKKPGRPPTKKPAASPTKKLGKKSKTPVLASVVSNEVAFRKLVLDLGLERAKGLLAEVEKKIAEVIAGK